MLPSFLFFESEESGEEVTGKNADVTAVATMVFKNNFNFVLKSLLLQNLKLFIQAAGA